MSAVRLSVIVPVRDGSATLHDTLAALRASRLPRTAWELIVVDDDSSDDSAIIAGRFADTVVRLTGQGRGPAYARNRGAELARGELLAFIDADVRVRPETLGLLCDALDADPGIAAVAGAYDARERRGLVADYWTLLQRFSVERFAGHPGALSTGCMAVRRDVLTAVGGFNEWHFRRPGLEGLDLGCRLEEAAHRTSLRPEITVAHLKRTSLAEVIADTWGRGVLVSRLVGVRRALSRGRGDTVHTLVRGASVLAATAATLLLTAAAALDARWVSIVLVAMSLVFLVSHPVHVYLGRHRSLLFTAVVLPLHLLVEVVSCAGLLTGWALQHLVGEPKPDPTTQAYAEIGVKMWPPVPRRLS